MCHPFQTGNMLTKYVFKIKLKIHNGARKIENYYFAFFVALLRVSFKYKRDS